MTFLLILKSTKQVAMVRTHYAYLNLLTHKTGVIEKEPPKMNEYVYVIWNYANWPIIIGTIAAKYLHHVHAIFIHSFICFVHVNKCQPTTNSVASRKEYMHRTSIHDCISRMHHSIFKCNTPATRLRNDRMRDSMCLLKNELFSTLHTIGACCAHCCNFRALKMSVSK